jgi:hypothetical protein
MRLFSPDSTHWYQRDGAPLHTVPSLKGEPRPTTLRDARKLNLLPSVTNVLGVIAKPELTAWLQEQAVMAALTLPRNAGESEDAFAQRVVADSQTTRDGAADFGTAFHAGAEHVAHALAVDETHQAAPWLHHYFSWFRHNVVKLRWTEAVLVHAALGYAGTSDLLIEHAVHGPTLVDLKTMKGANRTGQKGVILKPYKSWCYQLAAYRRALGEPVKCMNLIVNSVEPSAPIEHVWTEDELENGWEAFTAAHRLWVIEKGYAPCGGPPEEKANGDMVLTA